MLTQCISVLTFLESGIRSRLIVHHSSSLWTRSHMHFTKWTYLSIIHWPADWKLDHLIIIHGKRIECLAKLISTFSWFIYCQGKKVNQQLKNLAKRVMERTKLHCTSHNKIMLKQTYILHGHFKILFCLTTGEISFHTAFIDLRVNQI